MNLYCKSSFSIVITSLLICGNALAAKPTSVEVVNAPDVNVTNTADVNVTNTPLPVVISGAPDRIPVLITLSGLDGSFDGYKTLEFENWHVCVGAVPVCQSGGGAFPLPEGYMLVTSHVSARARVLNGGTVPPAVSAKLEIRGTRLQSKFSLGLLDDTFPPANIWEGGTPMHVTAPAGTRLTGDVSWTDFGAHHVEGRLDISGEFISVQAE